MYDNGRVSRNFVNPALAEAINAQAVATEHMNRIVEKLKARGKEGDRMDGAAKCG